MENNKKITKFSFNFNLSVFEKFGKDYRMDSKKFYRGRVVASDGTEFVWFASHDINRRFQTVPNLRLHMDGTFAVAPDIADQLFIISARYEQMVKTKNINTLINYYYLCYLFYS